MTSKFELRRGLLFGAFGSGLAAVLASCESAYHALPVPDQPKPARRVKRVPARRRLIYRHKEVPAEPPPDISDRSTGNGGGVGTSSRSGGGGSSAGGGGAGGWSDRRLKSDISAIGHSPSGVLIYRFRYVWGGPVYVGVMAQDLLETRPEAVIVTDSGYLMVDYDRIDVTMMPLTDYDLSRH